MPTWLLVLIIVLIVLALFGGFGYYRRLGAVVGASLPASPGATTPFS